MRIFLSGPMTGLPGYNIPAFDAAATRLRAAEHDVLSPADLDREAGVDLDDFGSTDRADAMRRDLAAVLTADAVAVLPGWRDSPGARLEVAVARAVGIPVLDATGDPDCLPLVAEETVLEEAQRLVYGAREHSYSHPADDYARTGRMWGAILGIEDIDPRICCLMMAAVKISREAHRHARDNATDLAGYAACVQRVAERQGLE